MEKERIIDENRLDDIINFILNNFDKKGIKINPEYPHIDLVLYLKDYIEIYYIYIEYIKDIYNKNKNIYDNIGFSEEEFNKYIQVEYILNKAYKEIQNKSEYLVIDYLLTYINENIKNNKDKLEVKNIIHEYDMLVTPIYDIVMIINEIMDDCIELNIPIVK